MPVAWWSAVSLASSYTARSFGCQIVMLMALPDVLVPVLHAGWGPVTPQSGPVFPRRRGARAGQR